MGVFLFIYLGFFASYWTVQLFLPPKLAVHGNLREIIKSSSHSSAGKGKKCIPIRLIVSGILCMCNFLVSDSFSELNAKYRLQL